MSDNLKQLTIQNHKKAERSKFVRKLLKGKLTDEQYVSYLQQQFACYSILEKYANQHGLFYNIERVQRANSILKDIEELSEASFTTLPTTVEYTDHIVEISNEPKKLMAHIYVRHMGDLSGGQIIKRFVPGAGRYYQFDDEPEVLKKKLRDRLSDDMAEEANTCFEMIQKIFDQLEESFEE